MPSFEKQKEHIYNMLESNDYTVRDGQMPGDDFRLFLIPPKFEVESEEIFKLKGNDIVHCGAILFLGGEMRDIFYKQSESQREEFLNLLRNQEGVDKLDFFEIDNDGQDLKIALRAEFHIEKLSEDVFADAMDRLNLAGGSIEDRINEYFEKLLGH
jgi:hypothetical protein